MIKTYNQLLDEYSNYGNSKTKITRLVKNGVLIKLKKGMYEDDTKIDHSELYANYLISPSYISFQYMLAYYGLIPEAVYSITSATTLKKKKTEIVLSNNIRYSYQDIPKSAFNFGLTTTDSNGDKILVATVEKALTDLIYLYTDIVSIKDIKELLFEDLRIDEIEFYTLSSCKLLDFASLYPSTSLKVFIKFIKKEIKNGKFIHKWSIKKL